MAADRGQSQQSQQSPQRNETQQPAGSSPGRTDQERAIRTGREANRSTGMSPRTPTTPVFGPGINRVTPLAMMRRMVDDVDRLFDNFGMGSTGFGLAPVLETDLDRDLWNSSAAALERSAWSPQIETFRRGDNLVVRADLPGLKKEDVKVEIDNGILSISGERRAQQEQERDGYYRSERSYGQFYRALPLPDGVSDEQCDATFKDGVLEVTLAAPKEPERKTKQVPIR